MIELRPYQHEAVEAPLEYWGRGGENALIDMATGLGKSVVIARLAQKLLSEYPDMRLLMLTHVRELVAQNAQALLRVWPDAPLGIYSAGLGKRQTGRRITFASIQSVYNRGDSLGDIDLVIIDEVHLVPKAGDGMYRTLLERLRDRRPDMRVVGLTATPFRLDSGRLDDGDERLFHETVYSYGIAEGIRDGWLSDLTSKRTTLLLNTKGVAKRGGEFVPGALEEAININPVTAAAVKEMITLGADRKSWLIFCAGVKHAHSVTEALKLAGISAAMVTGDTPKFERDSIINRFKRGEIRALCNVNVLTTGFDAPNVDMIAMLRPTLSTGLYVQMVGRGTRLAPGKENCLILDFAGNVRRHGPVDTVVIEPKKAGKADDEDAVKDDTIRAKECPDCQELVALNTMTCKSCGYEWPVKEKPKHDASADAETPILSSEAQRMPPEQLPVMSWSAQRWTKIGSPDSMRVTYLAGLLSYHEWICFEHPGRAGIMAKAWWKEHGVEGDCPSTITEALASFKWLNRPDTIFVKPDGKWWRVVGRTFSLKTLENA
jgi:DNA repair protein RadD